MFRGEEVYGMGGWMGKVDRFGFFVWIRLFGRKDFIEDEGFLRVVFELEIFRVFDFILKGFLSLLAYSRGFRIYFCCIVKCFLF